MNERDLNPPDGERNPAWLYDESDVEPDDFQARYEEYMDRQDQRSAMYDSYAADCIKWNMEPLSFTEWLEDL